MSPSLVYYVDNLAAPTVQVRACQDYQHRNYWLTNNTRIGHHKLECVECMKVKYSKKEIEKSVYRQTWSIISIDVEETNIIFIN